VPELTDRQRRCLQGFAERKTAKEIGRELGITHHAVEQHLKAARRKLGAQDTAAAARLYFEAPHTTGEPYYAAPELSYRAPDGPVQDQPKRGRSKLRDVATDSTELIQALSPRQTLLAIGACGVGAIIILSLIVAVAEGVAQLAP
jgi:DNA-binding CsgD family transcriptional regulator